MNRRTAISLVGSAAMAVVSVASCAAHRRESAAGTDGVQDAPAGQPASDDQGSDELDQQVESVLGPLSLEQKVAQLFFLRPETLTGVSPVTAAGDATREAIQEHPVGGLCYFGDNLEDADQVTTMLTNVSQYEQDAIGLPLLLSVDEEGGTVSRIGGADGFGIDNVGDMADVGATGDTQQAHDVCQRIAGYLTPLGFNLDFAPVADIANGSGDTMRQRSFGSTADVVAPMVEAAVRGFSDGGIACCAKHFPGIGGADGDSETEPISTDKTLDQMRDEELRPFQSAIAAGVPMVMVGHLSCPQVTGDDTPASLSHAIVSDLLRDELGFDGVIITDSLEMGAVSGLYPADQIGVVALQAGVDMLLMTPDFDATYQGVLDAVQAGTLDEGRIDESVRRIARMKLALQG